MKIRSSFEFISSPKMKQKIRSRLERKAPNSNESVNYSLVEYKPDRITQTSKPKIEIQNVKLHFLTEKPAREYLASKNEDIIDNHSVLDISKTDKKSVDLLSYNEVEQKNSRESPVNESKPILFCFNLIMNK